MDLSRGHQVHLTLVTLSVLAPELWADVSA